jgi:O-antigen/teichoic acid export membrane protein
LVFLFISFGYLTLSLALLFNVLGVLFGFIFGILFTFKYLSTNVQIETHVTNEIIQFCKWIYLTNLIYALYSRLDILILSFFKGADEVGLYSASLNILIALDLIYISFLTVLWPAASKLSNFKQFFPYIKKQLLLSICFSILIFPIFFSARSLIILFYTNSYIESVAILKIMLVGYFFMVILNPFLLLFYTFKKPSILTYIYITLLCFMALNCIVLIPIYGPIGSALSLSASRILGGIMIAFFAYREYKNYVFHQTKAII